MQQNERKLIRVAKDKPFNVRLIYFYIILQTKQLQCDAQEI